CQLLAWIERRKVTRTLPAGVTTARDLQKSNSRKYKTVGDAQKELDALVAAGCGEWVTRTIGPEGGAPSTFFRPYPRPTQDRTDTTASSWEDDHDGDTDQDPGCVGSVLCRTGVQVENGRSGDDQDPGCVGSDLRRTGVQTENSGPG